MPTKPPRKWCSKCAVSFPLDGRCPFEAQHVKRVQEHSVGRKPLPVVNSLPSRAAAAAGMEKAGVRPMRLTRRQRAARAARATEKST